MDLDGQDECTCLERAAALADVADLRQGLRTHGTGNVHTTAAELDALGRIEAYIRKDQGRHG